MAAVAAVAAVAVVEVRCPVILACWQEDVPFEPPCIHVWTSSSLLCTLPPHMLCVWEGIIHYAKIHNAAMHYPHLRAVP